jgi:hypothetical protein
MKMFPFPTISKVAAYPFNVAAATVLALSETQVFMMS